MNGICQHVLFRIVHITIRIAPPTQRLLYISDYKPYNERSEKQSIQKPVATKKLLMSMHLEYDRCCKVKKL